MQPPTVPATTGEPATTRPELLPGHADVVVVPVANPATATELLRLAAAFCSAGGHVTALVVLLDEAQHEAELEAASELEQLVAAVAAEHTDRTVELVRRPAPSVARGILEGARDAGADLLLVGVPPVEHDGPLLGPVAESVVSIAPCDVVVVRPGRIDGRVCDTARVVVTVDERPGVRATASTAVLLGDGLRVPVEAVHVQERGRPRQEGHGILLAALEGIEGRERVRRRLLTGVDAAVAVMRHTSADDLLVVGLRQHDQLRTWLFGSVTEDLLRYAEGPVLVVARHSPRQGVGGLLQQFGRWVRPGLTAAEEETLLWQARRNAGASIDYVTLLVLSAVLATLGLVQDSVAVIIGAMLVAPLLGPLAAASMGITTARTPLLRRSLLTLAIGTGAGFLVSWFVGFLLPLTGPTSQMLLRGSPTLLDVGVAAASGLVGAYATARKDIPAALAGVAIAAALVPPICTIGLGVALGDRGLATGSLLLYLTNVAAVLATGAAAYWWFGLHPVEQDAATRRRVVSAAVAAGLALVVVSTAVGLLEAGREREIVAQDVERDFANLRGVDLVDLEVLDRGDQGLLVTAVLRTDREVELDELAEAERALRADLDRPVELRAVVQQYIEP